MSQITKERPAAKRASVPRATTIHRLKEPERPAEQVDCHELASQANDIAESALLILRDRLEDLNNPVADGAEVLLEIAVDEVSAISRRSGTQEFSTASYSLLLATAVLRAANEAADECAVSGVLVLLEQAKKLIDDGNDLVCQS